jgi:hypothetical protein
MSNTYNKDDKPRLMAEAKRLKSLGKTNTEISNILRVPRKTIYNWIGGSVTKLITENFSNGVKETTEQILNDESCENFSGSVYIPSFNTEDDILRLLDKIAPIEYPAPVRSKMSTKASKKAVVIGDIHFGLECNDTLEIFYEVVSQVKPEKVIINGDTLDMFAISKYPKDCRHTQSIEDERQSYHKFLKILHDITVDFDAELFETNANHSGNSVEGRWWRYVSENFSAVASTDFGKELLSYENFFFPKEDWRRIKLVDEVVLPTNFIIYHGTVVRKMGGMSARGEYDKKHTSTMTNHTHRLGSTMQRVPSAGNRPEIQHFNYENGCACRLDPDYVTDANWQNGFSIVSYEDDVVGVEQILVQNGEANVPSLGKIVRIS